MSAFIDAVQAFFEHLAAVGWTALGIALLLHLLRLLARVVAWRNILVAAYPEARVPLRGVYGSYVAGVGVNSVLPARGGDLLKLYLVKRRVEGSTYPTLSSTLIVETLFDTVVAGAILIWALTIGVLPSFDVLPNLPTIDWHWPIEHPKPAIAIAAVWLAVIAFFVVLAVRRVQEFRSRFRQGFAILGDRWRFLRQVVGWQGLSWIFRGASVYFFLEAFHVPATARNALLVLAVQSISTLFPFTPGGVGTQQGLLVYVFRKAPVSKTALLSFSVGMHVAVTALNVLLGAAAILVMLRTLRWRQVVLADKEKAYARHQ